MPLLQEVVIPEFGHLQNIGSSIGYKCPKSLNFTILNNLQIDRNAFFGSSIKDLYYCGTKNIAAEFILQEGQSQFQIHVSPCYKYKTLFGISDLNRDCSCKNYNNCNTRSQIWYQNLNFLLFTISLTPGNCV